ncbi:hypothetical protein [Clostridium intestinale]|uniref:Uncharacterized protein n=1 Tax=Clostridium intestinale TaxID=36845 RepID=A0A7D7A6E5_9CLOT|nr:hypothetical protein [Clostridium intestinale]QLY81940.1 hypothetical protein HZF06_10245 [Clostridium intestinale]
MATIDEMNEKMTLFYSKKTGEITQYITGIADMNIFGNNKEDFEVIWDFITVEKDEYVMQNMDKFRVNEGNIKLKESIDLSKYM